MILLERSKICDEIIVFFAKEAGYIAQREQLFQLVLAQCNN